MSKIYNIMLAAVMIAATLTSCNKTTTPDPAPNTNTTDTNFYFTAKVDGVNWAADMKSTNSYANVPHSGLLTISASLTTVTDGFFLMNIYNYTGAGTYTVGTGGGDSYIRYTSGSVGNGTYSAWKAEVPGSTTTGTVVVTKDDATVIEGTVQFEGYSEEKKTKKMITEGKFRMKKS